MRSYGAKQKVRLRRQLSQIEQFARRIKDQAALDKLLEGSRGAERQAFVDMVKGHLPFVPKELSLDCPRCGRLRGQMIYHECVAN